MERWNSLPHVIRQIILGAGLFLLGAGLSFAYSYRPLHGALTWKVDSLETRLDERNRENAGLQDELVKLRKNESTRVDPQTLSQVESELARTKKALRNAEKKVKGADRKRRSANANADRWRKRYESLREPQRADAAGQESSPAAPGNGPLEKTSAAGTGEGQPMDSAIPLAATPTEPRKDSMPATDALDVPGSDVPRLP